jgi:orotidine-5'-phosphate decarboxylase
MNFSDKLVKAIKSKGHNPVMPGLDTDFDLIPKKIRQSAISRHGISLHAMAAAQFEYNKILIDAIAIQVAVIKIQVAFYEKYGPPGMESFAMTVDYAKKSGLLVIEDAKRNDISSTAEAYSCGHLGRVSIENIELPVFDVDALIINPYMGSDTFNAFKKDLSAYGKGAFVLVRTSNPSAAELQNLKLNDGDRLYQKVADIVKEWGDDFVGEEGYSCVGAVVGANANSEAIDMRKRMPNSFFVVPGFGAQGGDIDKSSVFFDSNGLGALFNNSRQFLASYKSIDPDGHSISFAEIAKSAVACIDCMKVSLLKDIG